MSFDILRRDLDIADTHFVQASAGTGKTFAIEHLFTRLLLETNARIEQILVVTFTRAATRELKNRLRATLLRTRQCLKEKSAKIDYLSAILEAGEESTQGALKKIDAALICFETAAIFTLHGFCHRMLSEFSFETKSGFDLPALENIHATAHYKPIVQDFLLRKLSSLDYSAHQLNAVLKKMQSDPFRLMHTLISFIQEEPAIESYPTWSELYTKFCDALTQFPPMQEDLLVQDYERLKVCYKGWKKELFQEQFSILLPLLQEGQCALADFERLLCQKEWFIDKMVPENLKVRSKLPTLHYPGIFETLRKQLFVHLEQALDTSQLLLRMAKDCQAHAAKWPTQREWFTPDHLLQRLESALSNPSFLDAVRKKFCAVIIDEFQDTDLIQWNIFEIAFLGHIKTICLVGDPKQSIYGFRSADIYTYLHAAKTVGEEKIKSLSTNYRSTSDLIDALNYLFAAPKNSGWLALPRMQRAMPIPSVAAGAKKEGEQHLLSRGSVHFFITSAARGRGSSWPTKECEENQLFPFIASEIIALRSKRNVPLEEIAILVKDRFQAQRLLTHLKQKGIPASFRKGESLADSAALNAFKDWMQAVLFPTDTAKLKVAIGGVFLNADAKLLSEKRESFIWQSIQVHMQQLRSALYQRGFAPFFNMLMTLKWPPFEHSIRETLFARGEKALYCDLLKLAEILVEEEMAQRLQGEDFLSFLHQIQTGSDEEQRFEVPPQEARDSVALMTVHLSKGLEFDTVFALALGSRHASKEEIIKAGKMRALMAFDAQNAACIEALEEIDAEKMRLLYVAMTRAKQQLYLPFLVDESEKPLKLSEASPIELFVAQMSEGCKNSAQVYEAICGLNRDKIDSLFASCSTACSLTYQFLNAQENVDCVFSPLAPSAPIPSDPHFAFEPKRLLSFTSLVKNEISEPECEESILEVSDTVLPLGAATGIVIHRLFELIFEREWHHPLNALKIGALIEKEIDDTALENFKTEILALIIDQLTLPLLPNLCLTQIPRAQLIQELEFLFPIDKQSLMKGFADLVFCFEEKYYLLDWKTNYLNAYSQEAMENAMQTHRYFLQAAIYAEALRRYVKLFDNRPFEEVFGGAFYVFVRGNAVYYFNPERVSSKSASVEFRVLLSRLFDSFCGDSIKLRIQSPQKEPKIGQNNPENRRSLNLKTLSKPIDKI